MSEGHAPLDFIGVAWRLGATLFFVVLNGFFVAAEFALVKVRHSRIDLLAAEGRSGAKTTQHILKHLDRYLSSCQLGITLASLILGALGEPAVSVLLVAGFSAAGVSVAGAAWLPYVSIGLAFAVITMLHMTVGEQAPKMWALHRAERMAMRTARTLLIFTWVLNPFITAINAISNWMLRRIGVPAELGHESSLTSAEIRGVLSLSARSGHISEREHEIAANVFRMIDLEVRHIVVPRVDVEFLTLQHSAEENLQRIRASSHTRLPLCELGLDTIRGFVHVKEVLESALQGAPDLGALMRPALYVSDTMALSDFLVDLQKQREHCAVVVDEHGTAIGLAFREDCLEEIVGPLGDEFDEAEPAFDSQPDGAYELSGRLALPEVVDRLGFHVSEDESEETIGGLFTALLGRLPRKGDTVRIGPYRATVLEVATRRVARLRMEPAIEEVAEEGADAPSTD